MAHIENSTFFYDLRLTSGFHQKIALIILSNFPFGPNSIRHHPDFIQIPQDPKKIEFFFTDTQNGHFQKNLTFFKCVLFQFVKKQSTLQVTPEDEINRWIEIPSNKLFTDPLTWHILKTQLFSMTSD